VLYAKLQIDLSTERCFLFPSFAHDKKLKGYYIQQMNVKLKVFVNEVHSYFKDTVATGREREAQNYWLDSWFIKMCIYV